MKTINITDKTGSLIAFKNVTNDDDLMIINESGITIRLAVETLRVMGRATQGVKLINLKGGDKIAAVAKVPASEDEEETFETEGIENPENGEGTQDLDSNTNDSIEDTTESQE